MKSKITGINLVEIAGTQFTEVTLLVPHFFEDVFPCDPKDWTLGTASDADFLRHKEKVEKIQAKNKLVCELRDARNRLTLGDAKIFQGVDEEAEAKE